MLKSVIFTSDYLDWRRQPNSYFYIKDVYLMSIHPDQQSYEVIIKTPKGYLRFIGDKGKFIPLIVRVADLSDNSAVEDAVALATKDIGIYIKGARNVTRLLPSSNKITNDCETLPSSLAEFIKKSKKKTTDTKFGNVYAIGSEIKMIIWDLSSISKRLLILPTTGKLTGSALVMDEDYVIIGFYTAVDGFVRHPK